MGERLAKARAETLCMRCSSWDHKTESHKRGSFLATGPIKCSFRPPGGDVCGQEHGAWLHKAATIANISHSTSVGTASGSMELLPALFEVVSAPISDERGSLTKSANILIDPGSDTDFIREDIAESLGLVGRPVTLYLNVVAQQYSQVESKLYIFSVTDNLGEHHTVQALGLPEITHLPPDPDLSALKDILSKCPGNILDRPQGQVDVLLGLRKSSLHGWRDRAWGDLILKKSILGPGWILTGSHPLIASSMVEQCGAFSTRLMQLRSAVQAIPVTGRVLHLSVPGPLLQFHEVEELGSTPDPVCSACAGCKDCTNRRRKLTEEEQEVLRRLEEGLSVDPDSGKIEATYPWKPCVRLMADNIHQARRVQTQIENNMRKKGTLEGFRAELLRSAEEGTVRKLTDEEIEAWHGPVNYFSLIRYCKVRLYLSQDTSRS